MAYKRACLECNGGFVSRQYSADFCCGACRRTFNNRRAQRGAALYDLLMIEATDPDAFQKHRLDGRASAMVEAFKQEDEAAGRKRSYKRPSDVRADTLRYQS
jgi:reverse gyrase